MTMPHTVPAEVPAVHAGGAPPARRILAHASFELRTVLRNGEQLLLTLILPALFLVVLARTELIRLDVGGAARIDVVAPGILALAVMSSAFTSQAISTGFDRRSGALRMLATTPLGRGGLLGGKILGVLAMQAVQVLVLGALAFVLGWRPALWGVPLALLAVLLGTAAFTALALLLAGTLRAEAVLAGANLLWVLLVIGGGIVLPAGGWTRYLPSGALGEAMRQSLQHGGASTSALLALVVLAGWAAVFAAAAVRWFRWH